MTAAAGALAATLSRRSPRTVAVPKGLGATLAVLMVIAFIFGLLVYVGIPLLIGLLVFPALGFTGWALTGLVSAGVLAWWLVIGLLRAAFRG